MTQPIEELWVSFGVDPKEVNTGLNKAMQSFQKFENDVNKITSAISTTFSAMTVHFASNFVEQMMNMRSNFDHKMREIWSISEMTGDQIKQLGDAFIEVSLKSGISAQRITESYYEILSANGDAKAAVDILNAGVQTSIAGNADLGMTIEGLTGIMNAWGYKTSELTKISDQMFVAVQDGKTVINEIAASIGQVSPMASTAGIGLGELLAVTASLTKVNLSTAQTFEAMNQAISHIVASGRQGTKELNRLGLEINAQTISQKGLVTTLKEIVVAAQKHADANNTVEQSLKRIFQEANAVNAILKLSSNNFQDIDYELKRVSDSANATQNAFEKMSTDLSTTINRINAAKDAFMLTTAEALVPLSENILSTVAGIINWINNLGDAGQSALAFASILLTVIPVIQTVTNSFILLKTLTGGWKSVLIELGIAVGTTTALFATFGSQIDKATQSIESKKLELLKESLPGKEEAENVNVLNKQFEKLKTSIDALSEKSSELPVTTNKLLQLAKDYNFAQETGLGKMEDMGKEIESILNSNEDLRDAISLQNDKYDVQIDKLKEIMNIKLAELSLEKEKEQATLKALQTQMKSPDYTNARTNTEKNISLYQAQQTVLNQNLQELGNKLQTAKSNFAEILKATPGIETYISYHDEQKSLKQRLLLLQEMQMVAKGYKDPVNAKKYFSDADAAELTELTNKLKEIESFITSFEYKNTNTNPDSFVGNKVRAYINAQKEIQDLETQTTQKTNELSLATANYYKMIDTKNKFDSDLLAVKESELKIQSLSTAIGSITTSIQNLTMPDKASTEGLIAQLDNYISTYLTKLKSYTDQSSQEYKRDYATLEDFIAKKKQLLSDSKTYQLSKENIDSAKVEALNQQIQSLDDLLTVGKVEQTIEQIESKILEYEQKLTNAVNKTSAQYKTDYEIFTLFVDKKISYLDEKKRVEAGKPEIDNTALESYISDIQKLQTLKNNYDLKEQSASIIDQYMQGLNTAILLDNKQLQETYLTNIKNIYDNNLQKLYESSTPDLVQITQLQKKISEVQMQLDALVVQTEETLVMIDDKLSNLQQGYNTAVQMQDNNLQLYFLNQIKDYYDAQLVSFSMLTDSLEKFEDIAALQQNIQKTTNLIDLLKPKETLETKEVEETAQIFGKEMGSNIYEGLLNGLEYARTNNNVQLQVTFLNELMQAYQKELTEAYKLPNSEQKQREIEALKDTIEKIGAEIVTLTPLGSFKGKVYEDTGRSAYESFEQGYKNAYETGNKSMQSLFLGSMKSTLEKEITDLYSKELTIPIQAEITSKESKLNAINALIANLKEVSSSPETVETTVTIGQELGKNIYEGLLTGIDYAASNSDIVLQSDMLKKLLTQYEADYNELIQTAPYPQKEADIQSLKDTINTITGIIEQLTPQILVAEMQKEIDNITTTAGNIINSDSIVQEQFDNITSRIATAKGNIGRLINETEGDLKTALETMYKNLADTENQVTAKGINLGFLTEKEADLKRAYAYAEKISDKETTIKNLIQYYSEELAKAVDSQRDRLKALITEYTKELNSIQINKITAKVEIDLDSINAEMQEKKNDVPFFEKFFSKDNISIFSPKTADIELENAKEILRVRREAYLELQKYKLTQEELSEEDKKKIELAGEESEKAEEIYKKKLKEKELRIEIYSQYQKTIDSLTEAGALSSEFAGILKDIGSLALQANVAFQLINTTMAANPIVAILYGLLLVVQAIASVINQINTNSAKALERQTAFNAALETQLELEKEYQKTKQYNQTNIQALKEEYTLMDDYMKKRNIAETEYQEAVDEFNSAYTDYMAQMSLWEFFRNGDMLTKAQERMDKAIEKMKKAGATIDEINKKIAEMPFNMAAELGVGLSEITNTIANEMQSALDKGLSFEQFQTALETSLKKATRNALIKALVDSLIIEKLKPYIEQLGNEILKGNDPKNSLAAFLENMKKIISDPRLKEIFDSVVKEFEGLGSTVSSGTDVIKRTLTEETGNRLAVVFESILFYTQNIDSQLTLFVKTFGALIQDGKLKVQMIQNYKISPIDYEKSLGR